MTLLPKTFDLARDGEWARRAGFQAPNVRSKTQIHKTNKKVKLETKSRNTLLATNSVLLS